MDVASVDFKKMHKIQIIEGRKIHKARSKIVENASCTYSFLYKLILIAKFLKELFIWFRMKSKRGKVEL